MTTTAELSIYLLSEKGDLAWPTAPQRGVEQITIGCLGDEWNYASETTPLAAPFPKNFAALFPDLLELHLWNLTGLSALPELPPGLIQLDIQNCPELTSLPRLPSGLVTLVLDRCPVILNPEIHASAFPGLVDLSLKASRTGDEWLTPVLAGAAHLTRLWLHDCLGVTGLPPLPAGMEDLRLTGCANLWEFPRWLPPGLQWLGIRGSNLALPPALFGEDEDANVASGVTAYLAELKRGHYQWDHEVKVILLGDGRCGKTSLARRLEHGPSAPGAPDDPFQKKEVSTHGIRLWEKKRLEAFPFVPVDGLDAGEKARARLNLWDFAGQDLYHNTHRLFLQSRAVYILCCTDHDRGHSLEDDDAARVQAKQDHDERKDLAYWKEQIDQLPAAPGMGRPPVIIVRTKADRDKEPGAVRQAKFGPEPGDDAIDFSAKSGQGLAELERRLSEAVGQVLGRREERRLPERLFAIKSELSGMKQEQNARGEPEIKKRSREEIREWIRDICRDGYYHENPDLFIKYLHQSGFLHADQERLKDEIIFDLRWAVDGIYAVFNRESRGWYELSHARGRFTAANLRDWAWAKKNYTAEEQNLFLKFMLDCRICFELEPSWWNEREETSYLAPEALPERDRVAYIAAEYRGDLAKGQPIVFGNETNKLPKNAVMELLVRLGRDWRRGAEYWRWGGQFENHYRHQWRDKEEKGPAPERTFVHLDWRAMDEWDFAGQLTLTPYGPDLRFVDGIVQLCRELPIFKGSPVAGAEYLDALPAAERQKPSPEGGGKTAITDNPLTDTLPIQIAISYAGDDDLGRDGDKIPAEEIPEHSLEKWPRMLAAMLRSEDFNLDVDDYRLDQSKSAHEQDPSQRNYLDNLMKRDFFAAFISDKYLKSPWCMFELMRIHQRLTVGEEGTPPPAVKTVLKLGILPALDDSLHNDYVKHWRDEVNAIHRFLCGNQVGSDVAEITAEGDLILRDRDAFAEAADALPCWPWFNFAERERNVRALLRSVSYQWGRIKLAGPPTAKELLQWAEDIRANASRPEVLFQAAARNFHPNFPVADSRNAHARTLYEAAWRRDHGDKWKTALAASPPHEDYPALNLLRLSMMTTGGKEA